MFVAIQDCSWFMSSVRNGVLSMRSALKRPVSTADRRFEVQPYAGKSTISPDSLSSGGARSSNRPGGADLQHQRSTTAKEAVDEEKTTTPLSSKTSKRCVVLKDQRCAMPVSRLYPHIHRQRIVPPHKRFLAMRWALLGEVVRESFNRHLPSSTRI